MEEIEQLSLFDLMDCVKKTKPKLLINQPIFVLSLDVVLYGKIDRFWMCGEDKENPYYGYAVTFADNTHTCVWDYLIGHTVFTDEYTALDVSKQLEPTFLKINPNDLQLKECKSFEYQRKSDNYKLTATIAKVGDNQLYEHGFMCYHFLREYPDARKRDASYKNELQKILEEAEQHNAIMLESPALELLYQVNKKLYASRGYAEQRKRVMV